MSDRAGKTAAIAFGVRRMLAEGRRVVVATPAGPIDGAQWLANRGLADDPNEYPAPRIARGDA